jgi:Ca-activated chloride channel family protein
VLCTLEMRKLLAIALAGVLALPAAAQTGVAPATPDTEEPAPGSLTIRRVVPEVQMVFAAEDHRGRPVLGLSAPQIRVLDNGITAQLTSLRAAAGMPLRLALLLDTSDSMRPDLATARRAAMAFLRRAQSSPDDQIFALSFAAGQGGATGNNQVRALATCRVGGQTALYDALISAAGILRSTPPSRRVLLLLSDGEDNYSRATLAEALVALHEANIAVYSVTVHSTRLEYPGDRVVRQLAAATGGRAFLLRNYAGFSRVLAEMENELRGQYVVGFRPLGSLAADEFHYVKILALKRGTQIRARAGYYVTSEK